MFNKKPMKNMMRYVHYSIKDVYSKLGPFKIKHSDIPKSYKLSNLEYRCEIKNLGSLGYYFGQFRKDTNTREGRGIYVNAKKELYEGFWFNGKQSGMGRFINSNGDIYQGEWKAGEYEGYGILINQEGMTYKGQWTKSMPDGNGYEIWSDGTSYIGEFKQGAKNGEGFYKWVDGSQYKYASNISLGFELTNIIIINSEKVFGGLIVNFSLIS